VDNLAESGPEAESASNQWLAARHHAAPARCLTVFPHLHTAVCKMAVAAHFKPPATPDTFEFTIRRPNREKSVRGIGVSFSRAFGCATAILFLLAGPASTGAASADPLPSAPLDAQWGGFYAGGELGGAWSAFDWKYTNANYFNTLGATLLGSDFSHNASGVIGGVFAGYNYQTGPWVLGVELSAAGSSLERQQPSPFFPAIDTYTASAQNTCCAKGYRSVSSTITSISVSTGRA
jgi:hypothetical protein